MPVREDRKREAGPGRSPRETAGPGCVSLCVFTSGLDSTVEVRRMNTSSTGLSENVAGALCYALGWVTGLVFLVIERQSEFVRFHAMQSLIAFGLLSVAGFVINVMPGLGTFLSWLISMLAVVLWILLMFKAWSGERYRLPWVGEEAEKQVRRMG